MRVVVRHIAEHGAGGGYLPSTVTAHIEMEDGSGEATEPMAIEPGQQLTYTVAPASTEAYVEDTQIQSVVAEPVVEPDSITSALCAKPECHHSRARHTGARSVTGVQDREVGLKTACDESGCPCGGFVEEGIEVEPDGYQRPEPKRIDISEFREAGFLQEANRLFFHQFGLALETVVEDCPYCVKGESDEGGECPDCHGSMKYERLSGVWDYRDDPEGMTYGEGYGLDPEKAASVEEERQRHVSTRIETLGLVELTTLEWAIQPLSLDQTMAPIDYEGRDAPERRRR